LKLYNSVGPNPQVVRIFMAERGIEIDQENVDIRAGESRESPYLAVNPAGQCPALETDSGEVITEITAICEYLDEKFPGQSLIGDTPEERAETRMWVRRIDLNLFEPTLNGFRFSDGLAMFENRIHCIPQAADDLKQAVQERLVWLDELIAGRQFVAGDRLTLADVLLYAQVTFANNVGQKVPESLANIGAWYARMSARSSVGA
jgi:glutathione S-transferase